MFCSRCGTWAPDDTALCPLCGLVLQVDNLPKSTVHERPLAPVVALVTYGGFWRRFAAAVLDSMILFFPAATVRVLLGLSAAGMFDPDTPASWVAALFEFALDGIYATLFLCSSARGTLGMQVMDLHVTDLKGGRITFARSAGRYFAQLLSILTFGIGYLVQLFTPRRQTLHDLMAGTVVVRPRPAPETVAAPVMRLAP
ncbi:MAG TPA: RDD family protein [Candidatus Eisenbacteria bacterium]